MKTLACFLCGVCGFAGLIDALLRVVERLSLIHFSVSGGALVVVCAAAPFLMKPTDTDMNDVGLVTFEDDEWEAGSTRGDADSTAA